MIKKFFHIIKKTVKKLLRPLYYSYIGYKVFSFIEWLTGYKIERHRICKLIGYYPNLKNPQSYNEKILWKKIYDRNPLLPIVSDKYRVREYLKDVLGQKQAQKITVPLLYVTDKPDSIAFDSLAEEYVIKPNHASGMIILAENIEKQKRYTIVDGKKTAILFDCKAAREEIVKVCKKWLSTPYGLHKHEWAYQKIKRKIIIEKLLYDNSGKTPANYNFVVFHGKCNLILVIYERFDDKSIARYTPEWEYLNVKSISRQADYGKKPENLRSALDLVELLGKPFDFIRVDLYLTDNKIYFGELTNYPMSGAEYFNPVSFDFDLGSNWKLVSKYWK